MDRPPNGPLKNPPLVNIGCATGALGLMALAAALVVRSISGHPNLATKILAAGGVIVALASLFGIAIYSVRKSGWQSRRLRGRWPAGDPAAALAAVRGLESVASPARGAHPKFPKGLVLNAVLPTPAGYAVTKSNLAARDRVLQAASIGYLWIDLPQALPTLTVSPDLPGGRISSDVNIESAGFNHRFRVAAAMPGASVIGVDHAQFARYAMAILHPRVAEVLMQTPRTVLIAIHGRLLGACISPLYGAEDVERLAAALSTVATLIPRFVWAEYGGHSSYAPRL